MHVHHHPSRAPARIAISALVAATACWGLGTVVSKQVVDDVAPLTLLPLQLAASSALLLIVTAVRREPVTLTPPVQKLAALGVLNPGAAYALGLVGLTTITASMSVLIWATEPVLILILAALVLREHIPLGLALLVSIAVTGVLLVVYQPGVSGDLIGILLTVTSVGFCALYTILTRRLLLDDASLTVVIAQQLAALTFAVLLASVAELLGANGCELQGLGATTLLAAGVSGVLYYGLGFWFYLTGLRLVPASYAASFLPLIPLFGLAGAYLTGERLSPIQWTGTALVVTATLAIATRQASAPLSTSGAAAGSTGADAHRGTT
ncbi:MAG TPA: DMT family transporter [Nocardioides sp.]|uniref:DMT family transporter n=1 Tax=Nocardioides sp. TaxID=35761 RepID=UPI002E2F3494|nr:DMT family transporter [Nocardioides sp.]HEX5086843.1 DMT family transporter [Nocardioides sp.]